MAVFTRKQARDVARILYKMHKVGNKDYEIFIVGNDGFKDLKCKVLPNSDTFKESSKWDDYNLLFVDYKGIEFFSKGDMVTIQGLENAVYVSVNRSINDIFLNKKGE